MRHKKTRNTFEPHQQLNDNHCISGSLLFFKFFCHVISLLKVCLFHLQAKGEYEEGKLIIVQTPIDPKNKMKSQTVHREIVDDELVMVSFTCYS